MGYKIIIPPKSGGMKTVRVMGVMGAREHQGAEGT